MSRYQSRGCTTEDRATVLISNASRHGASPLNLRIPDAQFRVPRSSHYQPTFSTCSHGRQRIVRLSQHAILTRLKVPFTESFVQSSRVRGPSVRGLGRERRVQDGYLCRVTCAVKARSDAILTKLYTEYLHGRRTRTGLKCRSIMHL